MYDTDAYGRVANFQRLPEVPADQYDALNSKLAQGREVMHIVTIRSGEQALIVTGGGFVGMYWLENGMEFWLAGPTLSEDQAVTIAEKL